MSYSQYPPPGGNRPRRPERRRTWTGAPPSPQQPGYRPEQPHPQYPDYGAEPWDATRPMPGSELQPPYPGEFARPGQRPVRRRRRSFLACAPLLLLALAFSFLLAVYLLAPTRTNILLLGIDTRSVKSALGRSDTMILTTIIPLRPYVGMLSIPRDLWVTIPGVGENRINTAHFFAEGQVEDSGPAAAMQTIEANFGVDVEYYVRIRFEGFAEVVDAMGGLDIVLPEPMSGYEAGRHHLTGRKALALVRDRSGSDDFFRMERGQLFLRAVADQVRRPTVWPRLPATLTALSRVVDTNIPLWQWPRLGFALLRAGPDGIDGHTINRDMVTGTITAEGANVLIPNWERINPVLLEVFGQ